MRVTISKLAFRTYVSPSSERNDKTPVSMVILQGSKLKIKVAFQLATNWERQVANKSYLSRQKVQKPQRQEN